MCFLELAFGYRTTQTKMEEWFVSYQKCVRHFRDVAQHTPSVQSLAASLNILLPYQRSVHPSAISLIPYIRRLVVTATDTGFTMQKLFGDHWKSGIGHLHLQERINYLFAAKSVGWLQTKSYYDLYPDQSVPFLSPLRDPQEQELQLVDFYWSEWLAMEDWMVGPRSPF